MVYFILVAGIVLIFLGIRKDNGKAEATAEKAGGEAEYEVKTDGQFESLLSENLLLMRLDNIDKRLSSMEDAIKMGRKDKEDNGTSMGEFNPGIFSETDDINTKIAALKSDGMSVEEIASKLNITKGEVLLRLGMRK